MAVAAYPPARHADRRTAAHIARSWRFCRPAGDPCRPKFGRDPDLGNANMILPRWRDRTGRAGPPRRPRQAGRHVPPPWHRASGPDPRPDRGIRLKPAGDRDPGGLLPGQAARRHHRPDARQRPQCPHGAWRGNAATFPVYAHPRPAERSGAEASGLSGAGAAPDRAGPDRRHAGRPLRPAANDARAGTGAVRPPCHASVAGAPRRPRCRYAGEPGPICAG